MKIFLITILSLFVFVQVNGQNVYTLNPVKDNSIYSENTNASSGAGDFLFTGRNNNGDLRRSFLKFDVSSIPMGEMVSNVELKLTSSGTQQGGARMVSIHSVTQDWGEGTSSNPSNPGQGGTATTADCTWDYTFWSVGMWTTAGGDFTPTAAATTSVDGMGNHSWVDPAFQSLVEGWIAGTTVNNGIVVIGDESVDQTAKKFNSREATNNPPELIVTTTSPTGLSASSGDPKFNILPNPVDNSFKIIGTGKIEKLEVFDLKGSKVRVLNQDFSEHNIKDLNRGIYLLKIQGEGYSVTQKLIKK